MRRRLYGDAHREVAASLVRVGILLFDRGDYAEAEATNREALAIARSLPEDSDTIVPWSMGNLAVVLVKRGKIEEGADLSAGSPASVPGAARRPASGADAIHAQPGDRPACPGPDQGSDGAVRADAGHRPADVGRGAPRGREDDPRPGHAPARAGPPRRGRGAPPGVHRHPRQAPPAGSSAHGPRPERVGPGAERSGRARRCGIALSPSGGDPGSGPGARPRPDGRRPGRPGPRAASRRAATWPRRSGSSSSPSRRTARSSVPTTRARPKPRSRSRNAGEPAATRGVSPRWPWPITPANRSPFLPGRSTRSTCVASFPACRFRLIQ